MFNAPASPCSPSAKCRGWAQLVAIESRLSAVDGGAILAAHPQRRDGAGAECTGSSRWEAYHRAHARFRWRGRVTTIGAGTEHRYILAVSLQSARILDLLIQWHDDSGEPRRWESKLQIV